LLERLQTQEVLSGDIRARPALLVLEDVNVLVRFVVS